MKAITIKQPWASLIVEGVEIEDEILIKDIENRTWPTKFRGKVLIHSASKSWGWQFFLRYMYKKIPIIYQMFPETRTWYQDLPTGKIIGSVEIVDCVINHPSIWAEQCDPIYKYGTNKIIQATYNWVLANPIKFDKPIPAKGKLSFWDFELPEEYKRLIK
jgi:hypothetical protein